MRVRSAPPGLGRPADRASASRTSSEERDGRIVNITSSTVREPIDNLALSNVVRPGVVGWAKSLARELGPKGITVNCIAPGRIDTERIREVYPDGPSAEDLASIPLGGSATTREMGDVVAFLCSEKASYVSGTVVLVDGALTRASSRLKRFSVIGHVARGRRARHGATPSGGCPRTTSSSSPTRPSRSSRGSTCRAAERRAGATSTTSTSSSAGSGRLERSSRSPPPRSDARARAVDRADRNDGQGASAPERGRHEAVPADRVGRRAPGTRLPRRGDTPQASWSRACRPMFPRQSSSSRDDSSSPSTACKSGTPPQLRRAIGRKRAGRRVRLTSAARQGEDVTVRTVANTADNSHARSSASSSTRTPRSELPIDVHIDLGKVGGPSAGLPFALEIARQLGRDVTHGCRVAATGELGLDGSVLPIGGIKQKTIGARRAHVDFFRGPGRPERPQGARRTRTDSTIIPVTVFNRRCGSWQRMSRNAEFAGTSSSLTTGANCGEILARGGCRPSASTPECWLAERGG